MTTEVFYEDRLRLSQSCGRAVTVSVLICLFLGIYCASGYYNGGQYNDCIIEGRINPNVAKIGELVNLKGIGPARAKDIIEYRQSKKDDKAFKCSQDLEEIKGIGPKTSKVVSQWLVFE